MLADLQEALALLCVTTDLRALRSDRRALDEALRARGLELDAEALAALVDLDGLALDRFASGLANKRRRAVETVVPHSRSLWPAFGARYLELLAGRPARVEHRRPGLGPGCAELQRLMAPLRRAAAEDLEAPAWLGDLLALEAARACVRDDGRPRRLHAGFAVHRALWDLDAGWRPTQVEARALEYRVEAERLLWRSPVDGEPGP